MPTCGSNRKRSTPSNRAPLASAAAVRRSMGSRPMGGSESGPLPTRPGHMALWTRGKLWCESGARMMRHISTRGSGALEQFVPGHFALGLIRQASEQARERGFRRAGGHAVRLAFHDAGEERFDRVDGDLALRFGLLDQAAVAQVVRILQGRIHDWSVPAVIRAGRLEHSFRAEELLLHVAIPGGVLDAQQPAFVAVGIGVNDIVMVGIPVAVDDLIPDSAAPHSLHRMRGGEPVQHVYAVAILLHNAAAGVLHPESPEAQFRVLGRIRRLETGHGPVAQNPVTHHGGELADLARAQDLLGGQVLGTEALLEAELNGLRWIGLFGGAQHALDARPVGARRLLAVDMLVGARGGLEVLRMQEHGRSDQHRVDIRLAQQLLVMPVGARGGGARNLEELLSQLPISDSKYVFQILTYCPSARGDTHARRWKTGFPAGLNPATTSTCLSSVVAV